MVGRDGGETTCADTSRQTPSRFDFKTEFQFRFQKDASQVALAMKQMSSDCKAVITNADIPDLACSAAVAATRASRLTTPPLVDDGDCERW